jgi:8-oxo-dGTP pyrophosphatase MutT (NUDIX family)
MWDGGAFVDINVPISGAENVMTPVIRVVVTNRDRSEILLQRRDDPSEPVRGLLEIPGGRWRAGEPPATTAAREVAEETGIQLMSIEGVASEAIDETRTIATIRPLAVVAGVDGAFPAVHMILVGTGEGVPRPEEGSSADVRWWPVEDVNAAVNDNREWFVPSSYAALVAFLSP